jgi:hypothetical protein
LLAGVTVFETLLYVYELAPAGFIVKTCPLQMEPLLTVMVGVTKTVTVPTAEVVLVQPAVLVPDTENVLVLAGEIKAEPVL